MISLHRSAPAQPTTVSIRDCANSSRTCISTFISRTISCSPALSPWKALRPEGRSQGKIRVHLLEDRIEELEVGALLHPGPLPGARRGSVGRVRVAVTDRLPEPTNTN